MKQSGKKWISYYLLDKKKVNELKKENVPEPEKIEINDKIVNNNESVEIFIKNLIYNTILIILLNMKNSYQYKNLQKKRRLYYLYQTVKYFHLMKS
jgi:hypothetical protein